MKNYSPLANRLRFARNFQPSVLRSSVVMVVIQYTSLSGFFVIAILSVMTYLDAPSVDKPRENNSLLNYLFTKYPNLKELIASNSINIAYLLLIIALLLLLIWKLTTMVRNRNAYILLINETTEEETE